MPRRVLAISIAATASCALASPIVAAGDPDVAALQVALHARMVYRGPIDGELGPKTAGAVRAFQRRAGLAVDGVAGPATRAALGTYARSRVGSRVCSKGAVGWDVAALQFLLAWHGFPSGPLDGHFGERTEAALRRYQRWARLPADGIAGPVTFGSLSTRPAASPVVLSWPLRLPLGDGFGPRGGRFHTGIDIEADSGTAVAAAGPGHVTYAGWSPAGWGNLVTVAHGRGVRTMYAHLSRVDVDVGEHVVTGSHLGLVGSTGHSTGPHLHFEVRLRGASIDPLRALR